MMSVQKSLPARRDLIEIWAYVAKDSLSAADNLIDDIEAKLCLIADNPGIGQRREDLAPGIRSFPVGKYLLFYKSSASGIELIRVLHGARDVPRRFDAT